MAANARDGEALLRLAETRMAVDPDSLENPLRTSTAAEFDRADSRRQSRISIGSSTILRPETIWKRFARSESKPTASVSNLANRNRFERTAGCSERAVSNGWRSSSFGTSLGCLVVAQNLFFTKSLRHPLPLQNKIPRSFVVLADL